MSDACNFDCLGAGACLYALNEACGSALLTSSNLTYAAATANHGLPACGCVCNDGQSSSGSYYTDPAAMSVNCQVNTAATDVMKAAVFVTGFGCVCYALRCIVFLKLTSTSTKQIKGLPLHVRSLCFHVNVLAFIIIIMTLKNEDDSRISLDQSPLLFVFRIFIAFQVMGTCVEVTTMWVNLLPIKVMQNEPIMGLITFVTRFKFYIEAIIFAGFAVSAVAGLVADIRLGLTLTFATIILTVPFPMFFVTMVSVKLYEKMVPDDDVSTFSFFKILLAVFTRGANTKKPSIGKFSEVVFKLRFSIFIVCFIGSGAILFSVGLAFVPLIKELPDYLDSLLFFCGLGFLAAMEFVFSPKRITKAAQNAKDQATSHISHHSTADDVTDVEEGTPKETAKVLPSNPN
ncbi:hypothetical protein TL16_g12835 [Triparma laevis f. inornata]|uniref:Uncharacterized protein n=1 Tax=Triparma laevis f. inornata TaxID=1714386 RepID=A0A9W7BPI0_9STRA|nr:hypothetical protein TL16_g12835 [Triparma laevis f. inornata]